MTEAKYYIDAFNLLKGQVVTRPQLKKFAALVKGIRGCEVVRARLKMALNAMGKYKRIRLQFEPISSPVEAPKTPTRSNLTTSNKKDAALKGMGEVKPKPTSLATRNKRRKMKPLRGLVSGKDIADMHFEEVDLDGEYKRDFVRLHNDTQILIWGSPGAGKTVYIMKFCMYLAKKGYMVLFMATEEMNRSTLSVKCREHNIHHENLSFIYDFAELKAAGKSLKDFDVIVYDSIQVLGLKLKDYQKIVRDNPGRIHIPVVQTTKDGNFKGGQDWEHEVDQAGYLHGFRLTMKKNRLDPENANKMARASIDQQVEKLKSKKQIRDQVRSESDVTQIQQV